MHPEADGRRDADPDRLGDDDVAQLLKEREAYRGGRLPLGLGDRLNAATPDFAKERPRIDGKSVKSSPII